MEINKINVLHITNSMQFGGVQKMIFELANNMIGKINSTIIATSSVGFFSDELQKKGIEIIKIPNLSSKNPIVRFEVQKALNKITKDNKINLIHCHHRAALFFARRIPGNITIIYNNHTIYSNHFWMTHFLLRNIPVIADGIMAKKNVLEDFKIPDSQIEVINNAVDDFDWKTVDVPEIQAEKQKHNFIVVNSSRFHPQKGIQFFISAAKILVSEGLNISFFLVGDGELHDQIVAEIKRLNLSEKIHLLGFRKDIKNVLSQCDVLVLTSVYEGLPLTPLEAFSVKKTVVATNIDGTNEIIHDGENGILVKSKDPQSIANGIKRVYYDRQLLNELDKNAYQSFINKFSLECMVTKYLSFYQKVTN
jgi:glycosyltransferase involved in cell wall biosynthesis